jgi:hypothetical protein
MGLLAVKAVAEATSRVKTARNNMVSKEDVEGGCRSLLEDMRKVTCLW